MRLLAFLLFASLASADTLHFTQGTINATPSFDVIGNSQTHMSGQDISLSGFGTVDGSCGFCAEVNGGGTKLQSVFKTGVNDGSTLTIGGQTFKDAVIGGGIVAMGNPFILPVASGIDGNVFSITMPVTFSAAFFSTQGTLTFPKHGTATIRFVEFDGFWSWDSATYTLVQTPEPGTMGLLGAGLVAIGARLRRKCLRRAQAADLSSADVIVHSLRAVRGLWAGMG